MKCSRCYAEDPKYFFTDSHGTYCRRCIQLSRLNVGDHDPVPNLSRKIIKVDPVLEFELTPSQKKASDEALAALKRGQNCFVFAAAGAGKTEMSLASISYYLGQGKKVCFAISRRQVVLEIAARLQKNFPTLKVVPVCSGYTKETDGDLIVCTTHQLYRYPQSFDLLILDELDAFPYRGNAVLETIADNACTGQKLFLSATPDEKMMKEIDEGKAVLVSLFRRPHDHDLCVPKQIITSKGIALIRALLLMRRWKQEGSRILFFVPRIQDARLYTLLFRLFFKTECIHSKSEDKDEIMERFKNRKTDLLVSTTLLERGITVPSVKVIVFEGDHRVFTTASLIQIFGRTGRTFDDPDGEGVLFCFSPSKQADACIAQLEKMNRSA